MNGIENPPAKIHSSVCININNILKNSLSKLRIDRYHL